MNVTRLNINNFRNIENLEIYPDKGINIIFGENAQGKTNLIESIWLFSGFRSFRGSKDNDLIRFGEDFLRTEMDFYGENREMPALLSIPYSIGLGLGIIIFFNHFSKFSLTEDPTPIEIEMTTYEKETNASIIDFLGRQKGGGEK